MLHRRSQGEFTQIKKFTIVQNQGVLSAMRKIKKKKDSDVWSKEVPATLDKNLGRPS